MYTSRTMLLYMHIHDQTGLRPTMQSTHNNMPATSVSRVADMTGDTWDQALELHEPMYHTIIPTQ